MANVTTDINEGHRICSQTVNAITRVTKCCLHTIAHPFCSRGLFVVKLYSVYSKKIQCRLHIKLHITKRDNTSRNRQQSLYTACMPSMTTRHASRQSYLQLMPTGRSAYKTCQQAVVPTTDADKMLCIQDMNTGIATNSTTRDAL